VVIQLSIQHYMMLKRNLVYTSITRGKRLVVLVGQKRALAIAVKGQQVERRWSKLVERLREIPHPFHAINPGKGFNPASVSGSLIISTP
jgi:ATP-dependent exoDNAse (exonuclease V) alpha subunit